MVGCRATASENPGFDRKTGRNRSLPPKTNTIMNLKHLATIARNAGRGLAVSLIFTAVASADEKPFSKIVTFGDSLSDTGNAFILTGGLYPADPPNTDGRVSNGKIWVEQLAKSLGMKLKRKHQYAVAGARTDHDNFNAYLGLPLENTGLQSQVDAFLADSGPRGADPNALYTVWIGANDIFTALARGDDMGFTVYTAIQNTAQEVALLASHGARHILVVNLPDLGLTPFGLSLGQAFSLQLSGLTDAYNAGLEQALNSLAGAGIPTIRLDSAGLIREMVADPAGFGLVNVTDQAANTFDDASGYLFWDGVHPTTTGHGIVAERAMVELVTFFPAHHGRSADHRNARSVKCQTSRSFR
jgi:phospholipase/lecithinase/hemolysin